MSEPFFAGLQAETRELFRRTEPLQLKHVSQEVATYRFTVAQTQPLELGAT